MLNADPRTLVSGSNRSDWRRQKQPDFRQHFLKRPAGAARAWIAPSQFLQQFLVAMNHPEALSYLRLGWISFPLSISRA
jgi:hypothetical protein